jgi:hypothetical protein
MRLQFSLSMVMFFVLIIFSIPAMASPIYIVTGPTADSYDNSLGNLVNPDNAQKLDYSYAWMYEGSWIRNQNFTSTDYAAYWAPWGNRTNFPSDSDNITNVQLYIVYFCVGQFTLTLAFQTQNLDGTWTTIGGLSYINVGPYGYHIWREAHVDVTTATDWTPELLKNSTSAVNMTVTYASGGSTILVDYIGLSYSWAINPANPPSNPIFPGLTFNPSAMLGMVGFVGMIGTLPVAVWYYRRTEGSRIEVAVYALIIFLIFSALLIAGGGP